MAYQVIQRESVDHDAWFMDLVAQAFSGMRHCRVVTYERVERAFTKTIRSERRLPETIISLAREHGLGVDADIWSSHVNAGIVEAHAGQLLLRGDAMAVVIDVFDDDVRVMAAADSSPGAAPRRDVFVGALSKAIPMREPSRDESVVPVRFWRHGNHEAAAHVSEIRCAAFDEIEGNYQRPERLRHLLGLREPSKHGRIILWHGPPGTGKTHAVRCLARHWRNDLGASIEVVLDPERLFGDAEYMYDVLLSSRARALPRAMRPRRRSIGDIVKAGTEPRDNSDGVRLVIVEDAAEMFADDCRRTPGFSRLLNISDGLVGQGLNIVVLFTANEELTRFDPAILRRGRALQVMKFDLFTKAQAHDWLRAHGADSDLYDRIDTSQDATVSLADLYHVLHESQADAKIDTPHPEKVGF